MTFNLRIQPNIFRPVASVASVAMAMVAGPGAVGCGSHGTAASQSRASEPAPALGTAPPAPPAPYASMQSEAGAGGLAAQNTQTTQTSANVSGDASSEAPSNANPPSASPPPGDAGTGNVAQSSTLPLDDGQIAAVTQAIDNSELEAASVARAKASDPRVRQFALHMEHAHGDMKKNELTMVRRLQVRVQEGPLSAQLQTDSKRTADTLREESGPELDRDYIGSQVRAHTVALDLIDNRLLPDAKNPELRAELQALRPRIAQHLHEAQSLEAALAAGPPPARAPQQGGAQRPPQTPPPEPQAPPRDPNTPR